MNATAASVSIGAMAPHSAPDSIRVPLADADATMALGARLAEACAVGDVIALYGDLGAGKTTLARGVVRAWTGVAEETPSPTYTLVQTYDGPRGPLWHMDLYRLRAPEDAEELNLEQGFEEALCVIEWPQRLGSLLPARRLDVRLESEPQGRTAYLDWIGLSAPAWSMDFR